MKRITTAIIALMLAMTLIAACGETAYPTITLNSADYNIGRVYMAESMLSTNTINPMTLAAYTAEELSALKAGDSIELSDGCMLAFTVNNADKIYEYTAEEAALILSHADPLVLNANDGSLTTLDGTCVVGGIAYGAIVLNSDVYGIGTIYYAFSTINTAALNPMTVTPYTEDEVSAILNGEAEGEYVQAEAGCVLGMSVNGTDTIWWYNAEAAAAIMSHADPLMLNAETGEVTTMDGTPVA